MSEEAPVGSPSDGQFRSMRPRLAGNFHAFSRSPARDFGMGRATSTSSREEACRGTDMTWYGILSRD